MRYLKVPFLELVFFILNGDFIVSFTVYEIN